MTSETAADEGNERARLALDMFDYWVAKVAGSYAAAMNGVDAIIFTAGVGARTAPRPARASASTSATSAARWTRAEQEARRGRLHLHAGLQGQALRHPDERGAPVIARDTRDIVEG